LKEVNADEELYCQKRKKYIACSIAYFVNYCSLVTALLRNIYLMYFNIKKTGEGRGRVMTIWWTDQREGKEMQKKVRNRKKKKALHYYWEKNHSQCQFYYYIKLLLLFCM
jgi:hypothetical protein